MIILINKLTRLIYCYCCINSTLRNVREYRNTLILNIYVYTNTTYNKYSNSSCKYNTIL